MSSILNIGEKIHVIHRQQYEGDARRHFVGTIKAFDMGIARVHGYLFAMDNKLNQFVRRTYPRTRLIPLTSAGVVINVIPDEVEISNITYQYKVGGDTIVTDGGEWYLEVTHL
jgi:hypothetical protein